MLTYWTDIGVLPRRMTAYQQMISKTYNKNIITRRFHLGNLVLRKLFQNTAKLNASKLGPKWKGPYLIDSEGGKGAYWLSTLNGQILPRYLNVVQLKTYFA